MDERQKMQVENLREYLKLYHQLLLLLLTLAVTFFLFSWKFDEAGRIQFHETEIPMNIAWVAAFVLFLCVAGFARATLNRANGVLDQLQTSDLLDVILQYPSAATERNPFVRLGAVVVPMLLVLGGMSIEFLRESALSANYDWQFALFVALWILLPTGLILERVAHPLGSR
jgi:hypothetical protein